MIEFISTKGITISPIPTKYGNIDLNTQTPNGIIIKEFKLIYNGTYNSDDSNYYYHHCCFIKFILYKIYFKYIL